MRDCREKMRRFLGKSVTIGRSERWRGTAEIRFYPSVRFGSVVTEAYAIGFSSAASVKGICIGVLTRLGGDHPSVLVIAPEGRKWNQKEIAEILRPMEGDRKFAINPYYHRSCGCVVYRTRGKEVEYLLLYQSRSNTWSAPKGHMEENETERETALRETKEEAGIDAVITEGFLDSIFYRNVMGGEKTVVLFLARAVGTISVRPGEISHFRWVSLEDAKGYLRHASWIEVYEKADAFIRGQIEQ